MAMTRPANVQEAHVLEFCESLNTGTQPLVVPLEPLFGKPELECFSIVPEQVALKGGEQLNGWAIWEKPGVFIEAQAHAIWVEPDGRWVDITPKPFVMSSITFLPDFNFKYTGRQIDNIRRALVNDRDVIRFLHLLGERVRIFNQGDLADQYGICVEDLPIRSQKAVRKIDKEMLKLQSRLSKRYE